MAKLTKSNSIVHRVIYFLVEKIVDEGSGALLNTVTETLDMALQNKPLNSENY